MVTIRKISLFLLCLVVITSLSFSVFASSGTFTTPSGSSYNYTNSSGSSTGTSNYWTAHLNTLNSIAYWLKGMNGTSFWYYDGDTTSSSTDIFRAITYSLYYIGRELKLMNGGTSSTNYWTSSNVASVVTDVDTMQSDISTTKTNVIGIKTSVTDIASDTSSIDTSLNYIENDIGNLVSRMGTPSSGSTFWSELHNIYTKVAHIDSDIHTLLGYVNDLHTIFASPEDLALKQDQENNVSAATNNFLSGSDSSTSIGTNGIGKVKDLGDGVSSFFDTGVSATNLFDLLSDNSANGPWMWFTQAVADDLDGVAAANRNLRSSPNEPDVVDFYGTKMDELDHILGGLNDD